MSLIYKGTHVMLRSHVGSTGQFVIDMDASLAAL